MADALHLDADGEQFGEPAIQWFELVIELQHAFSELRWVTAEHQRRSHFVSGR